MRKNSVPLPLFLSAYLGASLLATAFGLLCVLAGLRVFFALASALLREELVFQLKFLARDAAGFALVSACAALTQYYLLSVIALSAHGRRILFAALLTVSLICGAFFREAAELSFFGIYGLSGLPVTLAALIGGAAALAGERKENPLAGLLGRFFDY